MNNFNLNMVFEHKHEHHKKFKKIITLMFLKKNKYLFYFNFCLRHVNILLKLKNNI